jgi:hypothetical protein
MAETASTMTAPINDATRFMTSTSSLVLQSMQHILTHNRGGSGTFAQKCSLREAEHDGGRAVADAHAVDAHVYELEEMLDGKTFFRCSKSVIVNLNKITKLKPEVTRNILATLTNGEVVVISRRNVKQLKALIGLDG